MLTINVLLNIQEYTRSFRKGICMSQGEQCIDSPQEGGPAVCLWLGLNQAEEIALSHLQQQGIMPLLALQPALGPDHVWVLQRRQKAGLHVELGYLPLLLRRTRAALCRKGAPAAAGPYAHPAHLGVAPPS